ncbi:hypothetical protein ERO13_D13G042150v2 [Gossypium hirsutum]|nr:hypothetical protein ERO13_D13G042150v2 [Gossypium hirsutum]
MAREPCLNERTPLQMYEWLYSQNYRKMKRKNKINPKSPLLPLFCHFLLLCVRCGCMGTEAQTWHVRGERRARAEVTEARAGAAARVSALEFCFGLLGL